MSLDFSKMRTAAYGLWSHSNRLFALSGNNALLEFLLDVSLVDIKERDALISRQYALVLMCFGRNLKKVVLNTSYALLVILFQGAPQLTENYLDSKKVRKAKYLDKLSFDLNLNCPYVQSHPRELLSSLCFFTIFLLLNLKATHIKNCWYKYFAGCVLWSIMTWSTNEFFTAQLVGNLNIKLKLAAVQFLVGN